MSERAVSSPPPRRIATTDGRRLTRLRPGDQRGGAILEFALVFPIFVFILGGLITFGVILSQKQSITNAAADGARAAVGSANSVAAQAAAQARVQDALGAPVGSPPNYTATYASAPCAPPAAGQCITVAITYNYKDHPIVPSIGVPGLRLGTPDSFRTKAVVQYS